MDSNADSSRNEAAFWTLLHEFVREPRVLLMVLELSKEQSMTFREFTIKIGFWHMKAAEIRDKMERWGLIVVDGKGIHGATQHIRLTPHGREVLELTMKMGRVVERAMNEREKE